MNTTLKMINAKIIWHNKEIHKLEKAKVVVRGLVMKPLLPLMKKRGRPPKVKGKMAE